MYKEDVLYSFILDNEIATEQEVDLVTGLYGYTVEKLNDIIWFKTEYHDIEQLFDCERDNFYFSNPLIQAFNLE